MNSWTQLLGLKRSLLLVLLGLFGLNSAASEGKRYIVSIESPVTYFSLKQSSQKPDAFQSQAFKALSQSGAQIEKLLDNVQMAIVRAPSAEALKSLQGKYGIVEIEEEFFIPAPKPRKRSGAKAVSTPEFVGTPWGIDSMRAPEAWNVAGKGAGIRVLVLDTGIDKDHPNLVSRFEKGRNFSTVDRTAPYPYFDSNSHGTHVAGTIAADGKDSGLVGVAPEAKILAGRVCTGQGCSSVAVVDGVNWGIQEKVDVMNLSLGGPFPSSSAERAYAAAAAAGIVVVCASGNDGKGSVSYPAAYSSTIAVGAIDEDLKKADFSNWGASLDIMAPGVGILSSVPVGTGISSQVLVEDSGKTVVIKSIPVDGSAQIAQPLVQDLVSVGLGKPEDFNGKNVRGKIAFIQRGEIAFGDKVKNAIAAGAAGVLMYNNDPVMILPTLGENVTVSIPVVFISQADGNQIVSAQVSEASIWTRQSDFQEMMGTSMASPHIAGLAALIKGVDKNFSSVQVRDILKSTAIPMSPANQTGAGYADAFSAVTKARTMAGLVILDQAAGL